MIGTVSHDVVAMEECGRVKFETQKFTGFQLISPRFHYRIHFS